MNTKVVRIIFIFFFFYLPVQYALVGIIGVYKSEPWPAFVFPGFKSVYVYDDGFEIEQNLFEVYLPENDSSKVFLPHEFFPEVPLSQISGFMRTHFRNDQVNAGQLSPDAVRWLRDHSNNRVGGQAAALDVLEVREYYKQSTHSLGPDSTKIVNRVTLEFN